MLCHSAFIAFLVFNVLFNFAFAAKIPAGPLPPVEWGKVEVVSRGGLEDYKFCMHCQKPKHPRAHHCSTCRTCILDMDHHCPFVCNFLQLLPLPICSISSNVSINNCVGCDSLNIALLDLKWKFVVNEICSIYYNLLHCSITIRWANLHKYLEWLGFP